jgi:hypothetical protein
MNGATLTFDFELSGYKAALTLDGESGAELLGKAPAVIKALEDLGASPTAQVVASKGNGAAEPETKICPLHHTPMKRRTGKGGDVWYSHKAVDPDTGAEYWCRGKARAAA